MPREGILIKKPIERLTDEQVRQIHDSSLGILTEPGLFCFNRRAAEVFQSHGAEVSAISGSDASSWTIKIPEKLVTDALASAPSTITLGSRNPDNALVMRVTRLVCITSPAPRRIPGWM